MRARLLGTGHSDRPMVGYMLNRLVEAVVYGTDAEGTRGGLKIRRSTEVGVRKADIPGVAIMRWIETAHVSFLLLAACSSKARPRVACRRTAAVSWLLSSCGCDVDSRKIHPSVPQRMNGRMRPTAPMVQPHIHQRLIENDPGSDYSSMSCVPHIFGVQIHGYEEKRVD